MKSRIISFMLVVCMSIGLMGCAYTPEEPIAEAVPVTPEPTPEPEVLPTASEVVASIPTTACKVDISADIDTTFSVLTKTDREELADVLSSLNSTSDMIGNVSGEIRIGTNGIAYGLFDTVIKELSADGKAVGEEVKRTEFYRDGETLYLGDGTGWTRMTVPQTDFSFFGDGDVSKTTAGYRLKGTPLTGSLYRLTDALSFSDMGLGIIPTFSVKKSGEMSYIVDVGSDKVIAKDGNYGVTVSVRDTEIEMDIPVPIFVPSETEETESASINITVRLVMKSVNAEVSFEDFNETVTIPEEVLSAQVSSFGLIPELPDYESEEVYED